MSYNHAGPSSQRSSQGNFRGFTNPDYGRNSSGQQQFDIFEWYPQHESCRRYFLDQAQHSGPVQALAAFINILLPCQWAQLPVLSSAIPGLRSVQSGNRQSPVGTPQYTSSPAQGNPQTVSLIPYIRRLVATGLDHPGVLHGWFGDDWVSGIGPQHETERRNYLFAAKSSSWLNVKLAYDISPHETIPFLRPLQSTQEEEIQAAESTWSEWLAMQDWMVGPRAPDGESMNDSMVKDEPES